MQTKSCLPKVRQAAHVASTTKELHMMSSQESSKASAISHNQTQMKIGCIKSPFIHLMMMKQMKEDNKDKVLTDCADRGQAQAEIQKAFYFPPSLSPSLSVPPPHFPQLQDAAWTSARCHGNQDWGGRGGISRDHISLGAQWSDA